MIASVLESIGSSRAEKGRDDIHFASTKASIWWEGNHPAAIVFEMPVCSHDVLVGRVEEDDARPAGRGRGIVDRAAHDDLSENDMVSEVRIGRWCWRDGR